MIEDKCHIPIERGGGKLESQRALAEAGFPVPKSRYLYYPDLSDKSLITASFDELSKPIIVRGSHPNDWHGYIDVLPTFTVETEEGLQLAIRKIQMAAASEALRIHAQDWGQPFTPEVHVLAQELSSSTIRGSMLRHPHLLDQIDINYVEREKDFHPQNMRLDLFIALQEAINKLENLL